MSCTICSSPCGVTMNERVSHAKSSHGFPNCKMCPCVFKSVTVFNKHLVKPHKRKKCRFNKCKELVICGNELQHAKENHGFPLCPVCGETLGYYHSQFYSHLNAHVTEPHKSVLAVT